VVAGQADILVVPDIESGNMLAKQLEYLADAQCRHRAGRARADRADQPRRLCRNPHRLDRHCRRHGARAAHRGKSRDSCMSDAVLTLNAGSSSIKFALFALPQNRSDVPKQASWSAASTASAPPAVMRRLTSRRTRRASHGRHRTDLVRRASRRTRRRCAFWCAGCANTMRLARHRGRSSRRARRPDFLGSRSCSIPQVIDMLRGFVPLAPLHQPHNLAGIDAMADALPGVPQVACFDTAFHRTQPDIAQMFALPRRITAEGVLRYGFHGLSYEFIADVLPQHLPAMQADGRVIVAHLGNGASMCGMVARRSQATSMGFTAVDGLMMGTRTGSLDPGVLLYLMDYTAWTQGADPPAVQRIRPAGRLRPVVGHAHAARIGDCRGAQAVDLFCYRAVREIGSLAAAIGGLDALVFTGGIGEHGAPVRERVCGQLGWFGLTLDASANDSNATIISATGSRIAVCVIPTNEEWIIARHTAKLIA
jgi:acetate kinase